MSKAERLQSIRTAANGAIVLAASGRTLELGRRRGDDRGWLLVGGGGLSDSAYARGSTTWQLYDAATVARVFGGEGA